MWTRSLGERFRMVGVSGSPSLTVSESAADCSDMNWYTSRLARKYRHMLIGLHKLAEAEFEHDQDEERHQERQQLVKKIAAKHDEWM